MVSHPFAVEMFHLMPELNTTVNINVNMERSQRATISLVGRMNIQWHEKLAVKIQWEK